MALNTTSNAALLNLFETIGALREVAVEECITRLFAEAYRENPFLATKIAFYGRGVRDGLGEGQTFRVLMRSMENTIQPGSGDRVGLYDSCDNLYALVGTP